MSLTNRRHFIGGLSAAVHVGIAKDRKPNFLFLISDDHAGYVLGCDGNTRVRTPHLDRLAAEGVRFASHYCNSPVCTPSRQSFFTGQLPHAVSVTVLSTPLSDSKPTLAKQLKGAGYATGLFGKMHFNQPGKPGLHGFDVAMTEAEIQRGFVAAGAKRPAPADIRVKPQWRPFRDPARIWLNAEKLPFGRYHEEMKGTFTAARAIEFMKEHKDGPFALWCSLPTPHSPYDFPIEDTSAYDPAAFPVPKTGPEDGWQVPLIFRDLAPAEKQGIAASYYTSVSHGDRNIGEVLKALSDLKLDQDTYVVYMADHGYCLGQHGRFEKHCGYDPALRVPLIMRLPGKFKAGTVVRDFTESVDVPSTILDVLGIDRFAVEHGRSLRPYLTGGKVKPPREYVFSEYLENEEAFVRTSRWKYIQCSGRRKRTDGYETDKPTPGRYWRLYDLKADPGEFKDVAARRPEVARMMRGKLLERFRTTHPEAGVEPKGLDPVEAVEFYLRPRDAKAG